MEEINEASPNTTSESPGKVYKWLVQDENTGEHSITHDYYEDLRTVSLFYGHPWIIVERLDNTAKEKVAVELVDIWVVDWNACMIFKETRTREQLKWGKYNTSFEAAYEKLLSYWQDREISVRRSVRATENHLKEVEKTVEELKKMTEVDFHSKKD